MGDGLNLSAAEALYLASGMEKRAISLYERALLVFGPFAGDVIRELLADERAHLQGFLALLEKEPEGGRAAELDAKVGDFLFEGGLTGAVREGAFDSPLSLLRYAADEEERAALRYGEIARAASGAVREVFLMIQRQEQEHLGALLARAEALSEGGNG